MNEKRQASILIAVSLFCCAAVVCYGLFYNTPVNIYEIIIDKEESISEPENASSVSNEISEVEITIEEDEKIDINTAAFLELMSLPGVGEATADAIIAYREENNRFNSVEEIMEVSGIGEKKYESLLPYIKVE